jgi:hypothetical protein
VLQWGRVRRNAERIASIPDHQGRSQLQWGRVRRNAESRDPAAYPDRLLSFNGAAFEGTRKASRWCSSITGNMTDRSFNGAAFEGTRKVREKERIRAIYICASMGPRSKERGKRSWLCSLVTAIETLQWGRVRRNAERGPIPAYSPTMPVLTGLQWGRVRRNAERPIRDDPVDADRSCPALQWGRVRRNAESATVIQRRLEYAESSFNGAAFEGTRKDRWTRYTPWPQGEANRFNGAAFEGTRKADDGSSEDECRKLLQWGRVRRNAESMRHTLKPHESQYSSTLQWGRVRRNAESQIFAAR